MAITNIYKGDLERSDIQKIYKGTTLLYEKVLPPQGETWVINGSPTGSGSNTYSINFTSNNESFTAFIISKEGTSPYAPREIYYNTTKVYNSMDGFFPNEAYRTVTFETAPTGDLLTWLQANAVKQ